MLPFLFQQKTENSCISGDLLNKRRKLSPNADTRTSFHLPSIKHRSDETAQKRF